MDILSSQSQNNIRQQFREMLQMLTKNLKASLFIIMNKTWKEDHLLTNHLAQISHLLQQLKFDQQSPSTSDVVVNANCAGMAPSYNCTYYFLGMEVLREPDGLILCQQKVTMDLLQEYESLQLTSVSSPLDSSVKL